MLVLRYLRQFADKLVFCIVAAFAVRMRRFRSLADQSFFSLIAIIGMFVRCYFGQLTNKLVFCIVTAFIVCMDHKIRLSADQRSVFVTAFRRVLMDAQRAVQYRLIFLECNCRKNERINGAEYDDRHQGDKNRVIPFPIFPGFDLFFCRLEQLIVFHLHALYSPS